MRTLREAILLVGHSVQFVAATTVVEQLAKARGAAAQFAKPNRLVIDELGYLAFEPQCRASVLPAR